MDRRILHNMFNGCATDEELTQIRSWVNESPENKEAFYHERAFFDALRLNDFTEKPVSQRLSISLWKRVGAFAAAAIALFFVYTISGLQKESQQEMAYNTITVPAGQRVELKLSDGTHVWLNALSEISYPAAFNGDKREVRLKGEAFFDVAKNESKKFIVHTGRCEVEVLGTQFNVESDGEEVFSTALLRGSVKVTDTSQPDQSVVLEPNSTVRLDNGRLTVTPITDFNPYTWKDGVITFKNISFKELMKKLEKNYGIRIVIENPNFDNYACSGKFRISDGVEAVLRALQQDAHFSFERESGTEIHIK